MTKELSQDELGAAGESLFSHLCDRAPFVCNKSDRDRTGWDFVVEAPMPAAAGLSLDQRSPTAAVVQVKATAKAGAITARLSSVEYLAKDPRPAFIVVWRLRRDGEPIAGYLIHLIGPVLGRVLRRLRQAQAKGETAVNRATISFDYHRLGQRFDPTPAGLRTALLAACGDDPGAYLLEKQRQREELGYEDGGLMGEATFWVESADHLTKVLMGLEPLRPARFWAFDTRFGIAIPYTGSAFDELEEFLIQPPSLGACQVTVRGPPLSPPAVFEAEMLAGPPLHARDAVWLMIKHDDFILSFRQRLVSFETQGSFESKPRTLAAWSPLLRALRYLAEGQGSFTFSPAYDPTIKLDLPLTDELSGPYLGTLPAISDFVEAWTRLLVLAGVTADAAFSFDDFFAARDAQIAIDVMIRGGGQTRFAFDAANLGDPTGAVEALYFNSCGLGETAISFAAKVTLAPNPSAPEEFVSVAFLPLDARPAIAGDLQDYGEEIADKAAIRILINPANIIEAPFEQVAALGC